MGKGGAKSLSKRFSEHRADFKKLLKLDHPDSSNLSAMALHCLEQGHPFDSVRLSLLHRCEKSPRLNKLEEFYTIDNVIQSRVSNFNMLNDLDSVFLNSSMLQPTLR